MIKEFNVNVRMEERWIPAFLNFLNQMESNGVLGHSSSLSFFADGDGDFRPKFKFDIPFEKSNINKIHRKDLINNHKDDWCKEEINPTLVPEYLFDADIKNE